MFRALPKVNTDIGLANSTRKAAPTAPSRKEIRRSTVAVRAIRSASPEPAASAIWRTPLLLRPMPTTLWVRSATELYNPIKPTPAGPSNRAIALVRMIPMPMPTTDDPPINAEDFSIWP